MLQRDTKPEVRRCDYCYKVTDCQSYVFTEWLCDKCHGLKVEMQKDREKLDREWAAREEPKSRSEGSLLEEKPAVAASRVCGNCRFSPLRCKRGLSIGRLRTLAQVIQNESTGVFWTENIVKAAREFEKIFQFEATCKREKVSIHLLDEACFQWRVKP